MLRDEIGKISSTKKDLRSFGLSVGGVFFLIGALLLWKERPAAPWLLGGGALLALGGLLLPAALKPLQRVWMTLAVILGFFMTRVILALLFFLALTPLALVARLTGKRFLVLRPDAGAKSYWIRRGEEKQGRERYEKQY